MTSVLADARRGHRGLFAFAVAMAVLTRFSPCWRWSTTGCCSARRSGSSR